MLLTSADGLEVWHLPAQARQLEQTLRHTQCLAHGQIEQALNGQTELTRCVAVHRRAAPLAAGTIVPAHVLVQPDQPRAAVVQGRVVIFSVGRTACRFAGVAMPSVYPLLHLCCCRGILQQSWRAPC